MINTINELYYPENAYYDIFGEKLDISFDAEETLEYVIKNFSQRETDIFMCKYKDEMTLGEIGEKYNLTKSRVQQILAKTLRKLRYPPRSRILMAGYEIYLNKIIKENEEKKKEYNDRIIELNDIIQKQAEEITEYQNTMYKLEKQIHPTHDNLKISIDALHLSVRSWNCLTRSGIETIQDIIEYKDLIKIRNLGQTSYQEIQDKLKAFLSADE